MVNYIIQGYDNAMEVGVEPSRDCDHIRRNNRRFSPLRQAAAADLRRIYN